MSRGIKISIWIIVPVMAIGAMIYFALHSPSGSGSTSTSGGGGGPASWDAATSQYIADQHTHATEAMQHKDFTQARAVLQPLLEKYPGDAAGHAMLAKALIAQGRWHKAFEEAERACVLDDKLVDAHMLAGIIAERFDKLDIARHHYQRANELQPGSLQSALYLANICMKQKDWANADLYALQVIHLDPSQAIAYAITAQVAANQGQTERAIEQWEKALVHTPTDDPKYLTYTMQRVQLLRRRDMAGREEALNVLMSLPQKMRDDDRRVTEELAQTYLSLERPGDAADAWIAWLHDHPMDGPAAAEAGIDAQRAGQTDRAKQLLAIAQRLAPQHPLTGALKEAIQDSHKP